MELEPSNRKIVTRSPSRTVRLINLPALLPAPVEAESSLEADFVRRAVLIANTKNIVAQPFRLPVSPRGYVPDYLVIFSSENFKAVVETKIARKVDRYRPLFDRAADFLRQYGYIFYVVTEKILRHRKIDRRVARVLRYTKANYDPKDCERVENLLVDYPQGLSIGSLRKKADVTLDLLLHLISMRRLTTGTRILIDDTARINIQSTATTNTANQFETALGISPWNFSGYRDYENQTHSPQHLPEE